MIIPGYLIAIWDTAVKFRVCKFAEFLVNLIHIQKLVLIIHNFAVRYAAPDSYQMIDSIFMSLNIRIIPMIHVVCGPIIGSRYRCLT